MADHVGIREIHDDRVEVSLFNRFNHVRRRSPPPTSPASNRKRQLSAREPAGSFTRKRLLHAAVEKIGNVRVLFSFRHAQILEFQLREDIRQNVLQLFRAENIAQPRPRFVVLRQPRRRPDSSGCAASANSLNPGSARARVIWRARSARKLKKMTASSSRIKAARRNRSARRIPAS